MASKTPIIVVPDAELKPAWRGLYDAYATFYRRTMTEEIAETVWQWLTDPGHELEGLIAVLEERPVGLAHYRRMPSPLNGRDIGFLDDLFVAPHARGGSVGEALLANVRAIARGRGWPVVRWITADDNYRARALYDRVATKTMWNTYEMKT